MLGILSLFTSEKSLMFKLLTRNVVEEVPMLAGKSGHRVQHGTRRHARQRDALPSEEVGEEVEKIPIETAQQLEDSIFPAEPE